MQQHHNFPSKATNSVTAAKIVDGVVTKAKLAMFVSIILTADGTEKNIAHGLGVTPSAVLIIPVTTGGAFTITEGSHGNTNVVVTITSGVTYKVVAFA